MDKSNLLIELLAKVQNLKKVEVVLTDYNFVSMRFKTMNDDELDCHLVDYHLKTCMNLLYLVPNINEVQCNEYLMNGVKQAIFAKRTNSETQIETNIEKNGYIIYEPIRCKLFADGTFEIPPI